MAKNNDTIYLLSEESPFQMQEAYKNLRTNIQFSLPDGGCPLIGITSSGGGEGKSTTSVNTAIAFAQLGKKVAIIDGDLRMPSVAKKLGIQTTPGLSNYLIGANPFEDCFKLDSVHDLYVIPSGNIPPEPTWLLQSKKMKDLIKALKSKMDYIFIDLPPVNIVADAPMMADIIDGYLVVAENGSTTYSALKDAVSALKLVNAKILGFVNNRSDMNGKKYYKYKKDYSYGYGYEDAAQKSKKQNR